jgi:hypothetical protein
VRGALLDADAGSTTGEATPLTDAAGKEAATPTPGDDQGSRLAAAALLAQQLHDGRELVPQPADEVLSAYLWALLAVCPDIATGVDVTVLTPAAMRSLLLAAGRENGGLDAVHAAVMRELRGGAAAKGRPGAGQGLVPDPTSTALLVRYEAHLERSLARALSALGALQAARKHKEVIIDSPDD